MNVCTRCLRVAQKQAHAEQLRQVYAVQRRNFAISNTRYQKPQTKQPESQSTIPPPIPITTPTATSNITADVSAQLQNEQSPAKSATNPAADVAAQSESSSIAPDASTASMQRQINHNLRMSSPLTKVALKFAQIAKGTADTYKTYGVTEMMVKSCTAQAAYTIPEDQRAGIYIGQGPPKNAREEDLGTPDETNELGRGADSFWFKELGLEPTFSTWAQVSMLHMYVLTVRMRALPDEKDFREHQRYFLEHFSAEAEVKMELLHNLSSRTVRNKYLKDLFSQWRGALYAYDEGLVKGDAVLAATVWRNLWKADENVDWTKVAMVVAYMRRLIFSLARPSMAEIAISMKDNKTFWDPAWQGLDTLVSQKSRKLQETV